MSVLSAQSIAQRCLEEFADDPMISPFTARTVDHGKTYGLSACGYDIRVKVVGMHADKPDSILLSPGQFMLLSSVERIKMPTDLVAIVHDKSSWAREGLALQNTVLEPGWEGWITLELTNHGPNILEIFNGMPIAQLLFHKLDMPTIQPYDGKYQNQEDRPVEAIKE